MHLFFYILAPQALNWVKSKINAQVNHYTYDLKPRPESFRLSGRSSKAQFRCFSFPNLINVPLIDLLQDYHAKESLYYRHNQQGQGEHPNAPGFCQKAHDVIGQQIAK